MKGLSSLERIVTECISKNSLSYSQIQQQTGLHENVCFNILQALVVRGIISTDGATYRSNSNISPLVDNEINSLQSRQAESMELIEALIEKKGERIFRFQKIALDERDEKIFRAMLQNMESFLIDCHKRCKADVSIKDRKVVFWGMDKVSSLMNQMVVGADA